MTSADRATVVVFAHVPPWPVEHGLSLRSAAILTMLADLGHRVILALPASPTEIEHDALVAEGTVAGYYCYRPTALDRQLGRGSYWLSRLVRRRLPYWWPGPVWLGLSRWTQQVVAAEAATALVVLGAAHTWTAHAVRRQRSAATVLDFPDLLSANDRLWSADVRSQYAGRPGAVADLALRAEVGCVRRCDHALVIAADEAARLRRVRGRGVVHVAPNALPARAVRRVGPPDPRMVLAVLGANPFNEDALRWLGASVVPLVRAEIPGWELTVAGSVALLPPAPAGIRRLGLVDDLESLYAQARCTVCPVSIGTGQPSKVIDSLARGVPVVALPYALGRTLLQHEVNGLVAAGPEAFAAAILRLLRDDELRSRLAAGAAASAAGEYRDGGLRRALTAAVGPPR